MSSWLSLSLPSLFFKGFDDDDDDDEGNHPQQDHSPPSVKDANISSVIGRQLRGVAAFLAPPPTSSGAGTSATEDSSSETLLGIKNDLVEIGGSFKTKLSLLSSNKAVTEISRFASNLLQFGDAEEKVEGEGLGITDELVEFVRDISKRPELWLDFPMELGNDFDRSDIQREHTTAIEEMVPSIAALRHEISNNLDEEQFWKIYFTLLLPRLNENDSKLLSTPEIVEARDILLQKLQNKNMAMGDSEVSESVQTSRDMVSDSSSEAKEGLSRENEDLAKVFNAGLKINHCNKSKKFKEKSGSTYTSIDELEQSVEDISLSDLEIDDDYFSEGKQPGFRQAEIKRAPSSCESNDWVVVTENLEILGDKQKAAQSTSKGKGSESDESNEWLTIDDSDLDRPASG